MKKKTPVIINESPGYPRRPNTSMERRTFMAMLGGASAATLFGACSHRANGKQATHPVGDQSATNHGKNPEAQSVPEASYKPTKNSLRLPAGNEKLSFNLEDGSVSLVIWVEHSNKKLREYSHQNGDKLSEAVIKDLQNRYSIDDFSNEETLTNIEKAAGDQVSNLFNRDTGEDAGITATRISVGRMAKDSQIAGGRRPPKNETNQENPTQNKLKGTAPKPKKDHPPSQQRLGGAPPHPDTIK